MSRRRILLFSATPSRAPGPLTPSYLFTSDSVAFAPPFVVPFGPPLARISGQDDVVIERSASVWPFDRAPMQKAGVISLLNGDRALDQLLLMGWRDGEYELRWCWDDEAADPGHSWAACTIWQAGAIDSMSTTDGDRRIVFALADPLARWDVPLQVDMYPEDFANAAARGKPKPITLGSARFVPGTLRDTRVIQSPGPPPVMWPDAFTYDVHDGPISHVTGAYDRGDIFDPPPADWTYLPGRTGIKLANRPDNPVTANVTGGVVSKGASTRFDFVAGAWSAGTPPGWTLSLAGGATLTKVAGGARMIVPPGGTLSLTTGAGVLPSTSLWRVSVVVSAYVKGAITGGAVGGLPHVPEPMPALQSQATYEWVIDPLGATRWLRLTDSAGADTDITIASVTIEPVALTTRLPEFVRAIVERVRTGAWDSRVDTAAITALDTAAPYQLGTYIDTPITALTLLRRALDGWCGWVTSTRDGRLTVGRLRKRGGATGTVRLGRGQIITVRRRTDTAPGLATRLAGLRNHRVHSDSEIAAGVDDALRAELAAEYTVKTGSTAMPTDYTHADGADPMPTLLQDADQLQAAADYVTDLFGSGAMTWYELECAIDAQIADGLEMGDWIHVTHPVAGLDGGKWLRLMGAVIRFRSRRATLTLLEIP